MVTTQINIDKINNESQQKWRTLMLRANVIFAIMTLAVEVGMVFVLQAQNLEIVSMEMYFISYVLTPSLTNSLILGGGYIVARTSKNERILNMVPLVQMILLSFVICIVHHIFFSVFCVFCFPIFISVIYGDMRQTRFITGLGILCLSLSVYFGYLIGDIESKYQFSNYLVSVAILVNANVLSEVLMKYEIEKDRKLRMIYDSRMEILEQMKYDQKTGLYGHTAFQTELKSLVDGANQECCPAVAVLDIDDFKQVNDTYGHMKGDEVILEVARILRETCGEDYISARFGGEEFAIIFRDGSIEEYRYVVEQIRKKLEQTDFRFRRSPVTISGGIAVWEHGWSPAELFARADDALYHAKRQGKNQTMVYSE